jgi:CHASE3 domain sensor protein
MSEKHSGISGTLILTMVLLLVVTVAFTWRIKALESRIERLETAIQILSK